ncbi:unnamed protein product [Brassica oleracea var. botrytis]
MFSVAEYLITTFVWEKSFPLAFDFWNKLLELPSSTRWPSERVHQACELFDQNIQNFVMHSLLSFIGSTEVRYLLSGPSPGPRDANPFIDAAMSLEKSLVFLAVRRLLLNYIFRTPPNAKGYLYSDGDSQAFWKELVLQLRHLCSCL